MRAHIRAPFRTVVNHLRLTSAAASPGLSSADRRMRPPVLGSFGAPLVGGHPLGGAECVDDPLCAYRLAGPPAPRRPGVFDALDHLAALR